MKNLLYKTNNMLKANSSDLTLYSHEAVGVEREKLRKFLLYI